MEIGGHGGHIKIDVQGYERPETSDEDDANWLVARCKVAVAEFSCILKLSLVTRDFAEFLAQLEKAVDSLNGTTTFTTLEGPSHRNQIQSCWSRRRVWSRTVSDINGSRAVRTFIFV